ncbi:MAG: hypothetical protein H6897_03230 [Rhodobacteraceae bacterium]|jgi:hypothetical protein|uniref:hypothetical protein n=1 Tax=Albidovulum sp. TaxID=1872424 RepID=UPI001D494A3A|nr:hypothetical protein [uncultured Defluviimonas sp.]MCB2125409.1 hypothetical protein [Paracoccaceae bacterium]MCC0068924.1 hypothetical protein [Paracoccaceae bacterium]
MRPLVISGLAVLLLAGCQPPVPDSRAAGVGFEDYSSYQRRRVAEAEAARVAAASAPVQTVQGPVQNPAVPFPAPAGAYAGAAAPAGTGAPTAAELAQAGIGPATIAAPIAPQQPSGALPAGVPPANAAVAETPGYYPPAATAASPDHSGISDENDFTAVSSRESIESDKARIAQNRAAYQQVQPTELPERSPEAAKAVDLVQYALKAPNRLGEAVYPRSRIALSSSEKACARYPSPEAAQQAFLSSGGPKRDPKNLDPDGDGFACYWDPTPFQQAKN